MSPGQPIGRTLGERYQDAVEALNRSDWTTAQHVSMHLIREAPPHAGVYFVAGVAAIHLNQMPLAIACLEKAVDINPRRPDYLAQLARALALVSRTNEAIDRAHAAARLSPTDAMTLNTLGAVFTQAHAYGIAADLFAHVVELEPQKAAFRFNLATSLIFSGQVDAAEDELERCLALDSHYWKAHLTLSQQRRQTPDRNHVDRLSALFAANQEDEQAVMFLGLALAKEHEDLGNFSDAFAWLSKGKSAGRTSRRYDFSRDEALFDAIETNFASRNVAKADGYPASEPIFVFGMPRTGTTLVDRIISSHPDVQSAGELQDFGLVLKRVSGSGTSEMLDADTFSSIRELDWNLVGRMYMESTRSHTGSRVHFIDKLPHNFLYAGYIARALPNARLICVRRNPVDTCLSNFRQLFSQNSAYYDYSFDLLDTGRYFVRFNRLMEFWQRELPGRILEIDYESVVAEQEGSTRALLRFCDLTWDDACLQFQDNAAPVATASAVQVRSPMYATAVNRWKRYEDQIGDLLQLLRDSGIGMDERS